MTHGIKTENQYIHLLDNYHNIPKAVIAAVCISLILKNHDEDINMVEEDFKHEWEALYMNGIVPQRPRNEFNKLF